MRPTTTSSGPSFAALARRYLNSLNTYRDAKNAVAVAQRIGQDARELEHHAARMQAQHQQAVTELVDGALRLRDGGRA